MKKIKRVGVDLAKNVFQLHGADHQGETVWKRRSFKLLKITQMGD